MKCKIVHHTEKLNISINKKISQVILLIILILTFDISGSVLPYRTYIVVIMLFLGGLLVGKTTIKKNSLAIPLIFIYMINLLANSYAGTTILSSFAAFWEITLIYFLINGLIDDKDDIETVAKIIFWPVFIGGPLIGTIQMITGKFIYPSVGDATFVKTIMFNANQTNNNYSALTMMTSFFMALYLSSSKTRIPFLYRVLAIWSSIAILLTLSRGAAVSACIGLILNYFMKGNRKKHNTAKSVFFAVLFAMVLIVFFSPIYEKVSSYFASNDFQLLMHYKSTSTLSIRVAQWVASIQAFNDANLFEKIFGYGSEYNLKLGEYSSFYGTAHNIFFGQLAENGIAGLVCLIIIYIKILKKMIYLYKIERLFSLISGWITGIMLAYLLLSIIGWELWLSVLFFDAYYDVSRDYELEHL